MDVREKFQQEQFKKLLKDEEVFVTKLDEHRTALHDGYRGFVYAENELCIDTAKCKETNSAHIFRFGADDKLLVQTNTYVKKNGTLIRKFLNGEEAVYINDKFIAGLDEDMDFYAHSANERVLICFGRDVIGIVMPMRNVEDENETA